MGVLGLRSTSISIIDPYWLVGRSVRVGEPLQSVEMTWRDDRHGGGQGGRHGGGLGG